MTDKTPSSEKKKAGRKGAAESMVPFEQIQAVVDFMEERGLEEFELERDGVHIRLKRATHQGPPPVFESYVGRGGNSTLARAGTGPEAEAEETGLAPEDVQLVKSPIVGTFYAAPRPDAPAFVRLGDMVEVGQVLCIVEAMKLMNEIEADVAGEIVRIYVENAQPVEYGEPLFAIRPSRRK